MEILEIEQGCGACYILTSLFFKNFDDLASPSFLYHEEAFLAAQLNSLGLKTLYHPAVCVKHSCKAATGKLLPSHKWRIASKSHWELRKLERELINNHD
jgi:GT2 family glycosyltransferase